MYEEAYALHLPARQLPQNLFEPFCEMNWREPIPPYFAEEPEYRFPHTDATVQSIQ